MDFVAVVDQVIVLLCQRGRMAYRTLKRQFQLDDDAMEDLKDELIYAKHWRSDEAGRVLVWTGDTETPVSPASSSSLHAPPPAASSLSQRRNAASSPCCSVTWWTRPRSPSSSIPKTSARWSGHTKRPARRSPHFEGHIAQYLGDGLLVYFGYPQAHEDDAQRAVRTGLGMVEALGTLRARGPQASGEPLAVRVGIHTGLVVVGEVGSGTRQEQLALGDTPNIAARLQSLAAPNRVVISERTRQLVGATFDSRRWAPSPERRAHAAADL